MGYVDHGTVVRWVTWVMGVLGCLVADSRGCCNDSATLVLHLRLAGDLTYTEFNYEDQKKPISTAQSLRETN